MILFIVMDGSQAETFVIVKIDVVAINDVKLILPLSSANDNRLLIKFPK